MAKRAEGVQQAIAYLQLYKGKYSLEILKQQLRQNGYPDSIIEEAARQAFLDKPQPQAQEGGRFFDIRHTRAYASGGSKFLDFIVGFFGLLLILRILGGAVQFMSDIFGLRLYAFGIFGYVFVFGGLYLALPIAGIVYFWKRRKFLARGIFVSLILLPFIFFLTGVGFYFLRDFF